MIEPVAYMWKTARGTITGLAPNDNSHSGGRLGIPLYTAEQLHPRVKMTQEQKQLMMSYKNNKESFFMFLSRTRQRINSPFKLFSEEEIMLAWLNPEETIEIVKEKKWFVRSKRSDKDGYYWWLTYNGVNFVPDYTPYKNVSSLVKGFDTKEEAEEWTNPLTEAVQLPVDGE